MIEYTKGNLLEASTDALVNTVNTVGVMGKGIALMFKERFPQNMSEYVKACKAGQVQTGKMFVTESNELMGPRWIVNFPTKRHWRAKSQMEWISDGLVDLRRFIIEKNVQSIAIPPLGAGNGGLPWEPIREEISRALSDLDDVHILVYEPISKYQNVAKKEGVKRLTPARALVAFLVRKYWSAGQECSLLEIQKLVWFLDRSIGKASISNPLKMSFSANQFGPYSNNLEHLLNTLDGSYLHCDKRIADATIHDLIRFDYGQGEHLDTYLKGKAVDPYRALLSEVEELIAGFESPFGLELLSTVDWLISKQISRPTVGGIRKGLESWPGEGDAGKRKLQLFKDNHIEVALERLKSFS